MQRLKNISNTKKKRDGCVFLVGILIILILICVGMYIRERVQDVSGDAEINAESNSEIPINNQEENVSERIEGDNPQTDVQDPEKIEMELRKDFYHTYEDDAETQIVMENITKLTEEDFASAINWTENGQLPYDDGHVVILAHNDTYDTIVYGYESKVVGSRGIVIKYDGIYSYFDYSWDRLHGSKEIYEKDFDHDNINELCFVSGGAGTGISVEELIIFEKEGKDGTLIDFEFESEPQFEEIDKLLDFQIDEERKELVVYKNNREVKRLSWQEFGEMQSNKLKIDMIDQIDYSVQDDEILMYVDIGLWLHSGGPAKYQPNEEGVICFKVIYKENDFVLE